MIKINKNKNKDFVILNLTDFNLDENDWNNKDTIKLLNDTIDELVEKTHPDLITFSGDFSAANYPHCYEKTRKVFERINLPWTFVLGNHDNQCGEEVASSLCDILTKDKNCLFEKGDLKLGVGNFVIQICEDGNPIYALVLMDSHDRKEIVDENGNKKLVWSNLSKEQLEWLEHTVLNMKLKTTLITHIPIWEYKEAIKKAYKESVDKKTLTYEQSLSSECWNLGFESSVGVVHEGVCSYPFNGGEFNALKRSKYIELMLVGHDHINNSIIEYEGIKLAYATKTGSGCYWEKELNGGTLLIINKDGVKIEHLLVKATI